MRKLFFVLVFGFAAVISNAQTTAPLKVGYADVSYIISQMPEFKAMEAELQTLQGQLKKQYDAQVATFQAKYKTFNESLNNPNIPDAVKENSQRELQQLQENLQKFEQDSQANLQKKQEQLIGPIQIKIGKAIEDVAKENGYSFVFISKIGDVDVILYADDKLEVSDLVLKKMGITPPPPTATTPPKQ